MRSSWKNKSFSFAHNEDINKFPTKYIFSNFLVGKRLDFYNGKKLVNFIMKPYMEGMRISQFIKSRYSGSAIHIKRKKRKNKKL